MTIATICLLSHFHVEVFADVVIEEQYECPDDNAAFVTTCSGGDTEHNIDESNDGLVGDGGDVTDEQINDGVEDEDDTVDQDLNEQSETETKNKNQHQEGSFDDSDLVNEVLQETSQQEQCNAQTCTPNFGDNSPNDNNHDEYGENTNAMQQLQHTFVKLSHRYYDPLPSKAKCAVGTVCGFVSSRIALGVANRIVRLTGAVWVASEVLHTSGFCDETKCVPEEMRPWIGIVKRVRCHSVKYVCNLRFANKYYIHLLHRQSLSNV